MVKASRVVADVVSKRPAIDDALTFVYGFDVPGFDVAIRPIQLPNEIELLLRRVRSLEPRTTARSMAFSSSRTFPGHS